MANVVAAEVCVPTRALADDHAFFVERLGFRMESIYPADDPRVVVLVGHGVRLRLEAVRDAAAAGGAAAAVRLRLRCEEPARIADAATLRAPGGTLVELVREVATLELPATRHELLVRRLADDAPWGVGRAGMLYRDLVPGRLGGAMIASHIRIPEAGPVPDLVHFHDVRFQLIFCCRGWVRLVYEDQGPPFVLAAGDCVIQPPQIRHRVLEASAGLEVIEVGLPAEHLTRADHELALPTSAAAPQRRFGGQRFCRSEAASAVWRPARLPGFAARETEIAEATEGVASVQVLRPAPRDAAIGAAATGAASGAIEEAAEEAAEAVAWRAHSADVFFAFVLAGEMTLRAAGRAATRLGAGDAFVVPPGVAMAYAEASPELRLLEVGLPAGFATTAVAPPVDQPAR
jgi:quercetin dioxygenase-like cupin family protein